MERFVVQQLVVRSVPASMRCESFCFIFVLPLIDESTLYIYIYSAADLDVINNREGNSTVAVDKLYTQTAVMFNTLRAVSAPAPAHQYLLVRAFPIHVLMEAFVKWMTRGIRFGDLEA